MDCRTCEPTLIDLVHDELATDAANEARAHIAECASCRTSFERLVAAQKLVTDFQLITPPQAVSARLLQLADSRAAELRAAAAEKAPTPTLGRAVLDFVARFATGRQVGMATIMLLIAAVGLWSLPRMRQTPVASGTVVDAETDGEAAPSTGVEPAERLDLKVDPRARRIRSGGEVVALTPAAPAASAAPAPAAPTAAEPPSEKAELAAKGEADPLADLDDSVDDLLNSALSGPSDARKQAEQQLGQASGVGAASTRGGSAQNAAERRPEAFPSSLIEEAEAPSEARNEAAAAPEPTPPASSDLLRRAKSKRADSVGRSSAPAPGYAPKPASAPARAPSADLVLNPYSSSSSASKQSLLDLARSTARSRGCAAALPTYERVVESSPSSSDAGTALIEMAECKRALGQQAEAKRLLERAVQIPTAAPRARTLLEAAAAPAKP